MKAITSQEDFYQHWGFEEDPFAENTAEKEGGDLVEFFLRPWWFDQAANTKKERSAYLFGPRGMGKTALRFSIEHEVALKGPILVPYRNFDHVRGDQGEYHAHISHRVQLIRLMLVFGLLHRAKTRGREGGSEPLNRDHLDMLHRYFQSQTDFSYVYRNNAKSDFVLIGWDKDVLNCYSQLLKMGYEWWRLRPVRRYCKNHWRRVTRFVLKIFNRGEAIKELPEEEEARRQRLDSDFTTLDNSALVFGGTSWWVLVDGLDEHTLRMRHADAQKGGDKMSMASWLACTLMMDHNFLCAPDGVHYKFFLPLEIRDSLNERDIRLDRLRYWDIGWKDPDIGDMLDRRLGHFSKQKVTSLDQICSRNEGERLRRIFTKLSHSSPRRMNIILDEVLSEHVGYCLNEGSDPRFLTVDSAQPGLSKACEKIAKKDYGQQGLERIRILGREFNKDDVSKKLDLEDVESVVTPWRASGAIEIEAVGDFRYTVVDPVLLWCIDEQLILEDESAGARGGSATKP